MQANNSFGLAQLPLIHRLDPRTKLVWLLTVFIVVLLPERPEIVGLMTLLVLTGAIWARAWRELLRLKWLFSGLALFTIGLWSVLARGPTPLLWRISQESLAYGTATFLKLTTMMAAGLVLLATTRVEELFLGLVKLRLPYPVAFAFALALRWVPEIFATVARVKEAQTARGFMAETGPLRKRLQQHLPLLVPIFLLTLRRSQTMAWALESRGFQMGRERSYLLDLRLRSQDWVALALAAGTLFIFAAFHYRGIDRLPGLQLP
jgi:energy-coupling factor transport system permease protein|uniref:Energy-coupling factor transporter transmembrane protein EcfT n=1 Tax=Desulfobacca acetoxidans TaxID=60893 RepID=A0A7C3SJR7_9BACT